MKVNKLFTTVLLGVMTILSTSFAMETPQGAQFIFTYGELKEREDDLSDNDWTETVNNIASQLQDIYLPDINVQSIDQFKKDMLHGFSLSNLRKSLKNNFGVGHLGIARHKYDDDVGLFLIRKQDPEKTHLKIAAFSCSKGKPYGYLIDSSQVTIEDIKNYRNSSKRMTIKLLKSKKGEVPLIGVPTFQFADVMKETMRSDMTMMTQEIGRKYENIILDLRENGGGDAYLTYYLLSLLIGNNDPDIYQITLLLTQQLDANYYQKTEDMLNRKTLDSFYEFNDFTSNNFPIKKNIAEDITFKKMIILVNEETGSGGEIVAATLKSTLGSRICILGKPCLGSFEEAGNNVTLPHDFILSLPVSFKVFYSKQYRKLLTGCRLLPDIECDNMNAIMDNALQIIDQSTFCPETPSYERTIEQ